MYEGLGNTENDVHCSVKEEQDTACQEENAWLTLHVSDRETSEIIESARE